ncbi:MAG: serine hydrolase [Clostridia bacterium]|nr:serine hydrolase [Clostridia bacterium]
MAVIEKISIERAKSAESVGVSSKVVQAFVDRCMELEKELHSLMVIRHGKVACEAFRDPFGPEYKHMMYSVSKSFTSTAIGFAIDEGYFSLDTRFVEIFPEARGDKPDAYLEKLTVEDLLSMRSGLSVTPFMDKTKDRWFHDIITSGWGSEPGTEFMYISENMYLLCCIIHKMTKMSVIEYLTPRLFEPLGIVDPYWETCPRGIETGGWGLMIKTEDLAKFTLCYQQGGKFGGKQVVPEWWVKTATVFHADNSKNDELDSKQGYGYCFWRNGGYKNSYRADGMFSQFGIVFEDLDACFVMTGGEIDEQRMRDVIWEFFPKAFDDNASEEDAVTVSIPAYPRLPKRPRSFTEKQIAGKRITFLKSPILNIAGFPTSVITLPASFMARDKAGNITNVTFEPLENELVMEWSEGKEVNRIHVGMDGEYRWDNIVLGHNPYTTCSIGCWNSECELEIHVRAIETTAERILVFRFADGKVTLKPTMRPNTATMAVTLKSSVKSVVKNQVLQTVVSQALPYVVPVVDLPLHGKIEK